MTDDVTRAEVCVVACAEAWRGDGEILASPIGLVPMIGARLARATFAPGLMLGDGGAMLVSGTWAIGEDPPAYEGWMPYRAIFDLVWNGRRHVMMMPSQIDRHGNANISYVGDDFNRPAVQLRVAAPLDPRLGRASRHGLRRRQRLRRRGWPGRLALP
jgi:acyl CoA:acetate/3-ketoacid CoA transferase beta subunit